MEKSIDQLNTQFSIAGMINFEVGNGGLHLAKLRSAHSMAEVYLHGAHVTQFNPTNKAPVLWMSGKSVYQSDKPIRGGVPICFPWFGPRAGDATAPIHGFARIHNWQVKSTAKWSDGCELILELSDDEKTRAIWPCQFHAQYRIRIGKTLELSLIVKNTGQESFTFEEALHSYFSVADIHNVAIEGLAGTTYIDKMDSLKQKPEGTEPVKIIAETDRVYVNTKSTCVIHDVANSRQISIAKTGSDATVVWNPWIAKAKAMADFGDDEWTGMLCIETVNVGVNHVNLAPGATHEMRAMIGCE